MQHPPLRARLCAGYSSTRRPTQAVGSAPRGIRGLHRAPLAATKRPRRDRPIRLDGVWLPTTHRTIFMAIRAPSRNMLMLAGRQPMLIRGRAHGRRVLMLESPPYRVFLVGADTLAWDGLRTIVARMPDLRLVGETFDPRGAVEAVATADPDAVLLGSPLQGRSSSGLARLLREHCPAVKIVVFAAGLEPDELSAYASARVSGYLVLNALNATAVQLGLRAVVEANLVVTVDAVAVAIGDALSAGALPLARYPSVALKEREQAVLRGLASGLTREEIAAAEHLSVRTVERIVATLAIQFDAPSAFVLGMKAATLRLVG